ncbi:MAG: M20 family metallopeptidase, partial [Sporolactobacillus sp.]
APNRQNIIAKIDGLSSSAPLVFCGHLDTVPIGTEQWTNNPFEALICGGRIYGRGAADMKSGLVAMACAMSEIKRSSKLPPQDIYFIGTCGEEVDGCGARLIMQTHDLSRCGLLIIGEPTDCDVIVRQKGAAWVKVTIKGKTAHGSMPQYGVNALDFTGRLIQDLLRDRPQWEKTSDHVLGHATFSLNQIQGGSAPNMVADQCDLLIDFRLVPGQTLAEPLHFLRQRCESLVACSPGIRFSVETRHYMKPVASNRELPVIEAAIAYNQRLTHKEYKERGLNFYTDASVLSETMNCPIMFYGPGDDKMAHQTNEFVLVFDFLRSISFYVEMAFHQ